MMQGISKATLYVTSNSSWNLLHFRSPLIQRLIGESYNLHAAVPQDGGTWELEKYGLATSTIPIDAKSLSLVADSRLLVAYISQLRQQRPAAILAFTPKPNIYASLAARLVGIPVVNTITGLGTGFLSGALLERLVSQLYAIALQDSFRVFFHNDDDRNLFIQKRLIRPEQARVIAGSGVNLHHFSPTMRDTRSGHFTFLFIGRLLIDKGAGEFLKAAEIVSKDFKFVRFQIVGEPENHPRAIDPSLIHQSVSNGIVELLGTTDDVRPFIAEADCVVLPSYREGLPRAILEGSAMARPVIATDVPGCRQAIDHGVTGLLCKARSAQALADAMVEMIKMPPDKRLAMGKRGRNKAERDFSEDQIVDAYLEALQDMGL